MNDTIERKLMQSVIALLMVNIAWKIVIPEICVDFCGWKTMHVQGNYCYGSQKQKMENFLPIFFIDTAFRDQSNEPFPTFLR